MASGGGKRAEGSGLSNEGNYRARVADVYKDKSAAKKQVQSAGRLTLAAALGFGTVSAVAATQEEFATAGIAILLALMTGSTGRQAVSATDSGQKLADQKTVSVKYKSNSMSIALCALFAVPGLFVAAPPPMPILIGFACVCVFCTFACLYGNAGVGKLISTFATHEAAAQAVVEPPKGKSGGKNKRM